MKKFAIILLLVATGNFAWAQNKPKNSATPPPTHPPLTAVDVSKLSTGTEQLDLYLLMGQSNMKGRGVMPEQAIKNPHIINMHRRCSATHARAMHH